MQIRQIIGACMIGLLFVSMFGYSAYCYGIKNALIAYGAALLIVLFIAVASFLLFG